MPFTPSHVVAILPFVRTPLAPAALAIGAMTPDLPYFLPLWIDRDLTHSLLGLPTIDLLIGAITFALWVLMLRAAALDYSPAWLRERMAPQPRWRVRGPLLTGLLVIAALELGALTHLALDSFTHEGGFLAAIAPWTNTEVGPFSIANIIHGCVSVLTTVILALWVRRWAGRTPRSPRESRLGAAERLATWIGLVAVIGAVGLVGWVSGIVRGWHPLDPNLLGASFFVAIAVALAVVAVLAVSWRLRKVI